VSNEQGEHMAQVNISQASRMTGKSRTTIHRKLKNGALSIQNGLIDTSDLIRVFGALVSESEQNSTSTPRTKRVTTEQVTIHQQVQLEVLQAKYESLQRELELKNEIIEEKDKRLALLEHKPNVRENPQVITEKPSTDNPSSRSVYSEKEAFKQERKKESRLMKLATIVLNN